MTHARPHPGPSPAKGARAGPPLSTRGEGFQKRIAGQAIPAIATEHDYPTTIGQDVFVRTVGSGRDADYRVTIGRRGSGVLQ